VDLKARTKGTFGLLTNSARSELAAVDFDRNRVADIDPGNFGYNMLPVGALPEAVVTTGDGCRAVTLNRGSCDFSYVDTGLMLKSLFPGTRASTELSTPNTAVASRRLRVQAANGPIASRPGEIQFLPTVSEGLFQAENLCSEEGAFAGAASARVPYRALVTYPSCSLVALVEFPSGKLIDSVRVTGDGVSRVGTAPVCPVECNGPSGSANVATSPVLDSDAGIGDVDAGASAATGANVLVSALAVTTDGARAYVGGVNADAVFAVDVGSVTLTPSPLGARIPLHDGARGVKRLRLSVDAYGAPVGSTGQFLYAVVGDASVRVVEISRRALALREVECDTQVDSRFLSESESRDRGCHALPDDPAAPRLPRRLFAVGPGIRLSSDPSGPLAEPIPVDVAFAQLGVPHDRTRPETAIPNSKNEASDGAFAYVLYSNGEIAVINIAPTRRAGELGQLAPLGKNAVSHQTPIIHQPRNLEVGESDPSKNIVRGPPQIVDEPTSTLTNAGLPLAVRAKLDVQQTPRFDNTGTELGFARFPRPDETRPQQWTFTWEGTLAGTDRITARLNPLPAPAVSIDTPVGLLSDVGAQFCGRGVLAGDVVRFFGCTDDSTCSVDGSSRCVKINAAAPGMCFDGASPPDIEGNCGRFISSRRRYRVLEAGPKTLSLGLRLDEFVRPTLRECMQDSDCTASDPMTYAGFKCVEMYAGQGKGCFKPCTVAGVDESCRLGFVCENVPGKGPYCAEAPPLDTPVALECMRRTQTYNVSAGRSFLVNGQLTPRVNDVREQGGLCVEDASRDPRLLRRIPINAPSCNFGPEIVDTKDALGTGLSPSPNPCLFEAVGADGKSHVKALFETPDFAAVITNLEAPFGDGLTITTRIRAGFVPTVFGGSSNNSIAVPTRLLASPLPVRRAEDDIPGSFIPYLFMVDSGRAAPGNRGQILRANPKRIGIDSQFSSGQDSFQIQ